MRYLEDLRPGEVFDLGEDTIREDEILEFARRLGQQTTVEGRLDVARQIESYVFLDQVYKVSSSIGSDLIPVRDYVKGAKAAFTLGPNTYWSQVRTWLDR